MTLTARSVVSKIVWCLLLFHIGISGVSSQIWDRMPRVCGQISSRSDNIWCVTNEKELWRWVWGLHDWIWVKADNLRVQNVAVAEDDSVWAVAVNGDVWKYSTNKTWAIVPGVNLTMVSAISNTEAIGVDAADAIWHFTNDTWQNFTGEATWVSGGIDGDLWAVNRQSQVLHWDEDGWTEQPTADGAEIQFIDVYDGGRIVATDRSWNLYLWINPEERVLNTENRGPRWHRLENPHPNCKQASLTKTNIICVSDTGYINKS